jgi:hypothetical protein
MATVTNVRIFIFEPPDSQKASNLADADSLFRPVISQPHKIIKPYLIYGLMIKINLAIEILLREFYGAIAAANRAKKQYI